MIAGLQPRDYTEIFDGCIADLPNLCTILQTYLSTVNLCLLYWGLTLVIGFTVAYFLAFHVRTQTCRSCCPCSAPFRSGPRTSSA